MNSKLLILFPVIFLSISCQAQERRPNESNPKFEVEKTSTEWKQILSDSEYHVLREKGTERAFTGSLLNIKKKGQYVCAGCSNPLFHSKSKFDSGTGWPSFYEPLNRNAVMEDTDISYGMKRVEVLCNKCGGHLGHVFDDGPKPTGLRYCINSVAMKFVEE